jgi:hypothetical protein
METLTGVPGPAAQPPPTPVPARRVPAPSRGTTTDPRVCTTLSGPSARHTRIASEPGPAFRCRAARRVGPSQKGRNPKAVNGSAAGGRDNDHQQGRHAARHHTNPDHGDPYSPRKSEAPQ